MREEIEMNVKLREEQQSGRCWGAFYIQLLKKGIDETEAIKSISKGGH